MRTPAKNKWRRTVWEIQRADAEMKRARSDLTVLLRNKEIASMRLANFSRALDDIPPAIHNAKKKSLEAHGTERPRKSIANLWAIDFTPDEAGFLPSSDDEDGMALLGTECRITQV